MNLDLPESLHEGSSLGQDVLFMGGSFSPLSPFKVFTFIAVKFMEHKLQFKV